MSEIVVGIDLGTTNCCACVHSNSRLRILENEAGGRITPSYVFFTDQGGVIVGHYAKRMADAKPENGIYEIKRLIGREYDDPYVKKNITYLPYQVKEINNEAVIVIETKSQTFKKRPQDMCSLLLTKIKTDIEAKLNQKIDKVVITVPAYFTIAQREATLSAATNAGFTVLKLLNEPTAAALSYYYENSDEVSEGNYSLVYDLGGGTFDVAILQRNGSDITIVGVDGDSHLGGHDFDNFLVEHACKHLINEYKYNPKNDRRSMRRLKNECEEVKKLLSFSSESNIILNAFVPNVSTVEITITRSKFEELATSLFKSTIDIVDRCLKKIHLDKSDITEVILSGGSTRIPKIQAMLLDYFNNDIITKVNNPDECVAEGAAIQAALLSKDVRQKIPQLQIKDVNPLSLGISDFVHQMTFLIHKNTEIPTTKTTQRVTVYNNQTSMSFDIYEGERLNAQQNYFLGTLSIKDLTLAPPGDCKVSVTMSLDHNGILSVSATECVSNKTKNLKIAYIRGNRSESEIKSILVDARENKEEDEEFRRFAELKGYTIKYCVRMLYNIEKKDLLNKYREIYDKCAETSNRVKEIHDVSLIDEIVAERDSLLCLCGPICKKFNFTNMP